MGISRLVLGAQCVAAGSVEEVHGFGRFEGGLFKEVGTTVAGDGENLKTGLDEDITNKPRTLTTYGSD